MSEPAPAHAPRFLVPAEIALFAVSVATIYGFSRLFADGGFFLPMLVVAVVLGVLATVVVLILGTPLAAAIGPRVFRYVFWIALGLASAAFLRFGVNLLVIVIGGSLTVDGAEDGEGDEGVEADRASLEPGRFCVIEEGTPHSLTAGPQGAVFLTSWPQETEEPTTCWYPDPAWVRAEGRATA